MWIKTNLYAWTHSEHGWIVGKWWTLCGKKKVYFSTYADRQAREKGENMATFSSLKDAKKSFDLVPLSPNLVPLVENYHYKILTEPLSKPIICTSKTNTGNKTMFMILAVTFCSVLTCEEYQLTEAVSKPTCIRMMSEERKFLMSKPVEEALSVLHE